MVVPVLNFSIGYSEEMMGIEKKTGSIAVAVAAFMAIAGLGISSGAGRIDGVAANPQTKAEEKSRSSDESKEVQSQTDDRMPATKAAKVMRPKEETTAAPETTANEENRMNQEAPECRLKDFQGLQ